MATSKAKLQFVQLTQALYANLQTVDQNTLYFCKDTNRIYLGSVLMSRPAQVVTSLPAKTDAIQDTVYIRTSDGTIHYYNGTDFVQCYNKKVDDTAVKSVTVSGGTLTTKDFDSNSSSAYINGLVSGVAYNGGKLKITVTENGSTKTVEANVPVDNFLDAVERKEIVAGDLTGADKDVYAGCKAGDIGVLFTMVDNSKMFVKLTDLFNIYTVDESNSTSAVTVSIDGYSINAALKYDGNHFEQDATGALKIKASAVKAAVAVSGATANNLAGLDANGNTKDSGYAAGGIEFTDEKDKAETTLATEKAVVSELAKKMNLTATVITEGTVMVADGSRGVKSGAVTIGTDELGNSDTTLAIEAAVKAYADSKVARQTSATTDNVVLFGSKGEVKDGGYSINTTADYEDSNSASNKILVTEATLAGVVSKVVAGDMGDALKGKLDNVEAGKAGEIITATATGGVQVSGKKVGGATFAATPNANTVATEIAAKAYSDSVVNLGSTNADEIVTVGSDGKIIASDKKVGAAELAATTNANTLATEAAVEAAIGDAMSWTIITA